MTSIERKYLDAVTAIAGPTGEQLFNRVYAQALRDELAKRAKRPPTVDGPRMPDYPCPDDLRGRVAWYLKVRAARDHQQRQQQRAPSAANRLLTVPGSPVMPSVFTTVAAESVSE